MLSSEDFWRYSIGVYRFEEVKQLCLRLQDEAQLNVNLLLFCGYLDNKGVGLSADHFAQLVLAIEALDTQTQQLRAQRKAIKATDPDRYQQLLKLELDYEQQQQQQLIETVKRLKIKRQKLSNFDVYHNHINIKGDPNQQELLTKLQSLITIENK